MERKIVSNSRGADRSAGGGPLRDQIWDRVRQSIFDGELPPGMRLVERDLAARYGVSRVPVREAMRMLSQEGLVREFGARGMVVATLTLRESEELFEVRTALESLACRLAAEKMTDMDLEMLSSHLVRAREELALGNVTAAHRANSRFHDEINRVADNQALTLALEPLLGRLHWIFRQVSDLPELIREHEALLSDIASGDPDSAGAAAVEHVHVNQIKFREELLRRDPRVERDRVTA